MRIFQILIVSAVEICKQCLQTASAFGGLNGASPLDPTGRLPPSGPVGYSPQMKISGAAIGGGLPGIQSPVA